MIKKQILMQKAVIQSAFPERKIVTINGIDILMGGGKYSLYYSTTTEK